MLDITENKKEAHVRFMKKCDSDLYIWPTLKDESLEPIDNLIFVASFPKLVCIRLNVCYFH